MKMFPAVRRFAVALPLLTLVGGGSALVPVARAGIATVVKTPPKDDDGGSISLGPSNTPAGNATTGSGGSGGGTFTSSGGSLTTSTGATYGGSLTLGGSTVTVVNGGYSLVGSLINTGVLYIFGSSGASGTTAYTPGGTIVLNNGSITSNGGTTSATTSSGTYALHGDTLADGKASKVPALSGSAAKPKVGFTADGSKLHVKTTATVINTGNKTAKGVTATVYLSDDAVLDAADTKVATLALADWLPASHGKIGKGESVSLPIKDKVPAALAEGLKGKHLIVVLSATNGTLADAESSGTAAAVNGNYGVIYPGLGYGTVQVTGTSNSTVAGILWMKLGDAFTVTDGGILTDALGGEWTVQPGGVLNPVTGGILLKQGGTTTLIAGSKLTLATGQTVILETWPVNATSAPVVTGGTTTGVATVPTNEIVIGPITLP